jgi:hypothetical protein
MQEQQATLHQYVENDNMALPVASVGCFSTQECLEIVRVSEQQLQISGVAGTRGDLTHLRDSRIASIPPNPDTQWIFQKIQAAVLRANQLYRHELVGFREGLQVATYTNGGHYGWHLDIGKGSMSTRKLSVSVQLTDAHEYQGGDHLPVLFTTPCHTGHFRHAQITGGLDSWSIVPLMCNSLQLKGRSPHTLLHTKIAASRIYQGVDEPA